MLYRALMDGNDAMMRAIARAAVTRYAGMEPGRPVGGTYYLYRTLRQLDLDAVLERMMEAAREQTHGELTDLEERLAREEYEARLDALRREIEAEIRRRLVADRGAEAVAKSLRKPLPEDIDFMHASREELVALRKAIAPLTRKLAVRLARKRRHGRKGPLDFRSTVRHSLSYGGVPAEPKFRYPRPSKPEIMVVADISGSVAAFARFTLQMVYAISSQFSRVRSFVFIDGIDEVTDYFKGDRGHHRGDPPHQHRSRRDLGRRPLRLRPRLRGVLGALGPRDQRQDHGPAARRRPQQLPRRPGLGAGGDGQEGPPRVLAQPRAPLLLGHRRLHRRPVRHPLRRRLRVPQPQAAGALRRAAGLGRAALHRRSPAGAGAGKQRSAEPPSRERLGRSPCQSHSSIKVSALLAGRRASSRGASARQSGFGDRFGVNRSPNPGMPIRPGRSDRGS